MKKIIIGIVAGVLVLGGLIWIARPDAQNNNKSSDTSGGKSNGTLTVQESDSYDFGTISMAAGKVTKEFKIKNTSAEAVTINKMYTSCMCTSAALMIGKKKYGPFGMPGHQAIPRIDQEINPNEEATVEVTFDPAAHGPSGVGQIQRIVTIENNAGQPVELEFRATVTP